MSTGCVEAMSRRAICFFLAGCCLHSSVQAACGNIVVMSSDAQYMVLEPNTLRTLEVGSLWWLGIYQNYNAEPGSSQSFAIILTDEFMDLESGRYVMTGGRYTSVEPPAGFIPLEELGKNLRTQKDIPYVQFEQNEAATRFGPGDTIVSERFFPGVAIWEIIEDGHSILQLVDRGLRVIQTWEDPNLTVNLRSGFCPDGNLLYFRGGDLDAWRPVRILLEGSQISALPLRVWEQEKYTMYGIDPDSCTAVATKRVENDELAMDDVYFDYRDESIISTGRRFRYGDSFFFNYGANVLMRYKEPTVNYRNIQTDRFQTFDTESLSTVKDVLLDAEGAYLSDELICEPETPRAVLMGQGKIGLVDPNDLGSIMWKTLPWEFFTVFE